MSLYKTSLKNFFQNRGNRWYRGKELIRRFPSVTKEKLNDLVTVGFLIKRKYKNNNKYKLKK